jgi:hypothetical protein
MQRQIILRWIIAGALGASASGAYAALCKYVDANGHVTYSDSPVKGSTQSSCFEAPPVPPAPAPRASPPGSPASSAAPAPGGLPNVDSATQRKRDDSRRKILQDELAVEEKALDGARKALAEGEAVRLGDERNYQRYLERIQGLKDRVTQHEKNVSALKQELSNLR